jgi:L-alanine-DL-glutamate epimerase-like enolase superfamily enzyme
MSTYDALAALPVEVDGYDLAGLRQDVSSGFTRRTTIVSIHGAGETGVGEDVTYDASEQGTFQDAGSVHDLAGSHTLDSFSELIGSLDLFPAGAPEIDGWRLYRRWAFESAALDLALRQTGTTLAEALGREARPVTFVVSTRLGDPPSTKRVRDIVAGYPDTRFKLDPTKDWNAALVEELAALDVVATVDLKGAYHGTIVDNPADPALYRLVAGGFPGAWIEDPDLTSPPADAALEPYRDRITWDAIIHSVGDIEALPFPPRGLNIKPSRFGGLHALLDTYDYCAERGIVVYGGGQFELGPGRGQIQYLASLFSADAPNDVAPGGFNEPVLGPGLPASPLAPNLAPSGFRWVENGLRSEGERA